MSNKYTVADTINKEVNSSVKYMSDIEHYGLIEKWTIPDGYGDCEDYVLLKRVRLIEQGFSSSDLNICTCIIDSGEGHAVLFVNTDQGGFILDNRYPTLMEPKTLPYRWVSILRNGQWYELSGWS